MRQVFPITNSTNPNSAMDVRHDSIRKASDSWKIVQQVPGYRIVFGELLFRHIFASDPSAVKLFHFVKDEEVDLETGVVEDVFQSPIFIRHAKGVVAMLETSLHMMRDDDLPGLAGTLRGLGGRHFNYGVQPKHYLLLEAALLQALHTTLGKKRWSNRLEKHWSAVFKFIATAMMMGAHQKLDVKKEEREEAAGGTMLVLAVFNTTLRKLEDIYDQYAQ
eukprot:scaffold4887_cov118-Cylindrotheca_fusiformis.AAC.6